MRNNIDYGIYFSSDFCQIARMENGMPVIVKSDTLKDSMPLCVSFNKRSEVLVGDTAFNVLRNDEARASKIFDKRKINSFNEFTRTLGADHRYESSNTRKSYSSEELLAECFKKLKSFIADELIRSVVITVPSKFLTPQLDAVRSASRLAGFEQIELIHEPVAAAISYGFFSDCKNGYLLVFNFQDEFNASLCNSKNGIISIIDTERNNWLGQKNITDAIVNKIIIPYLSNNYVLEFTLEDSNKIELLSKCLRYFAEETKAQLYKNNSHNIVSNVGDLPFKDENGEELELDIEITQQDLAWVSRPIYQKSVDITIDLLKRNNLKGKDIQSICLIGNETYSPILRSMLNDQITDKIDTTVDPVTAIAKGAALFASTISVSDEVKKATRDKTKLQLDLKYEAATIELDELVNIKVLTDKSVGDIPEKIFVDFVRFDGAWSSGKKIIGEKATIIEVLLTEESTNLYQIRVFDELGSFLECEPNQITIQYGINYLPKSTLPYNIGIAKYFESEGKELFMTIKGLEKNQELPATGVINGYKTTFDIRPGVASDMIRIPIYQGEYNAEGTNPIYNNHMVDIIISGESLPELLPTGSDIDITIKVDKSQLLKFIVYFPLLNHTEELEIDIKPSEPITLKAIDVLKGDLVLFYSDNPKMGKDRFRFLLSELTRIEKNEVGQDDKMKVIDTIKKELIKWR